MSEPKMVYSIIIDKEPVVEIVKKLGKITDDTIGVMLIEGRTCGEEPGDGILKVIHELKKRDDGIEIYCDLCVCSETIDGHCRLSDKNGNFDMKNTNELILKKAEKYIRGGADWLVLSDMNEDSVESVRELIGNDSKVKLAVEYKLCSQVYNVFRSKAGLPRIEKDYHAKWPSKERLLKFACAADAIIIKPALLSADLFPIIKENYPNIGIMSFITNGEAAIIKHMQDEYKFDFFAEVTSFLKRTGASTVIAPQILAQAKKKPIIESEKVIKFRHNKEA